MADQSRIVISGYLISGYPISGYFRLPWRLVAETIARPRRILDTVRALRHPNYRIYFFSMLVSFTGTWMQSTAQSWLIYRLTGSPWLLGLVAFASQIPVFLLAPVGGVLADR